MNTTLRGYPTLTHVLDLAPKAAAEAFDVMILDPTVATRLVPTGPMFRDRPCGYGALRRLPATLRLSGRAGRGLPVVLEVLPFSDRRTELAIWTNARPHLLVERSIATWSSAADRYLHTLAGLMDARRLDLDRPLPVPTDERVGNAGQPATVGAGGVALPGPRHGRSAGAPKP